MKNYVLIIFLFIFSARPDLEVGGEAVGSPREDSLLPTDKQRKKIEKEGYSGVFSPIFLFVDLFFTFDPDSVGPLDPYKS
jgi:hypothetical protein